jgi:hypothetical protein
VSPLFIYLPAKIEIKNLGKKWTVNLAKRSPITFGWGKEGALHCEEGGYILVFFSFKHGAIFTSSDRCQYCRNERKIFDSASR